MKKVYFVLILTFALGCCGCAQLLYDYTKDELGAKEFTGTGYYVININSSPEDAEVYINEKFVGRTPLLNLRIDVIAKETDSGWPDRIIERWIVEPIYVYVVKNGYKKEAERLEFVPKPTHPLDRTDLKKGKFFFVLQKEE